MQSWGGPAILRIDRFSGRTAYQGFYLATEHFSWAPQGKEIHFRNVDVQAADRGPASLFDISGYASLAVYCVGNSFFKI